MWLLVILVLILVYFVLRGYLNKAKKKKENSDLLNKFEEETRRMEEQSALLKKETEKLRKESEEWTKVFNKAMENRSQAVRLEKEGDLIAAIDIYEQCVKEGIENVRLKLHNYAFDINRLVILYRKTKQKGKEISFLKEMITLHSKTREADKWRERLLKLEKK